VSKWLVEIPAWLIEVEATDEGDALCQASLDYSFMNEARAEEIEEEEGE
jgi:hypothetical protein